MRYALAVQVALAPGIAAAITEVLKLAALLF